MTGLETMDIGMITGIIHDPLVSGEAQQES